MINTAIRRNQDAIKITTNIVELQSFHTLGHEIGTIKRSVWYFWHQPHHHTEDYRCYHCCLIDSIIMGGGSRFKKNAVTGDLS